MLFGRTHSPTPGQSSRGARVPECQSKTLPTSICSPSRCHGAHHWAELSLLSTPALRWAVVLSHSTVHTDAMPWNQLSVAMAYIDFFVSDVQCRIRKLSFSRAGIESATQMIGIASPRKRQTPIYVTPPLVFPNGLKQPPWAFNDPWLPTAAGPNPGDERGLAEKQQLSDDSRYGARFSLSRPISQEHGFCVDGDQHHTCRLRWSPNSCANHK